MASAILTCESGNFTFSGHDVYIYSNKPVFELEGQEVILYDYPLFKLRGLDITITIGGEPTKPPLAFKPITEFPYFPYTIGSYYIPKKKKRDKPVYQIINQQEDEEEFLFILTMFLNYADNRLF